MMKNIFVIPFEDFMEFIKDLWSFLKTRKKYWLLPIISFMLVLGILIAYSGGSAVAPFIYTTF